MEKILLRAVAVLIFFYGISFNTNICENETIEKRKDFVIEEPEQEPVMWDLFTEAIIMKESRGDESAIGDNGKAVGVLQLHKIMVDEANRILKLKKIERKFTYEDRFDRSKSIEIFNIIQDFHNKERDFSTALDIWNPGHPNSYQEDIMKNYDELVENA